MQNKTNDQTVEFTNGETLSIDQLASYLDSLADDSLMISVVVDQESEEAKYIEKK